MKSANDQPNLAVATQEKMAVARPIDSPFNSSDVRSLMEAAVKQGSAMEVLKELRQMEEEMFKRNAKASFDQAMSLFQSKCPTITKSKPVQDNSGKRLYAYAPIERIEEIIRPIEEECGFTHSFDQDVTSKDGWVIAKITISHKDGHSIEKSVMFPLGTKTQIMSNTQQYAAALTFANRRVLGNGYGLVFAGEDTDMVGKQKPAGPSSMRPETTDLKPLAQELWDLLKPVRGAKPDWKEANNWLWSNDVLDPANVDHTAPHLTADLFRETIKKAKAKLAAQ